MNPYQQASFLLSVATLDQLPRDQGIEVAIVGRSNAGKSSALNKLANRKDLARVSKTPGRTQTLNFFGLGGEKRLVDLPGYGFARVSDEQREQWVESIEGYFANRACLRGLVLVMDIRHPLQPLDRSIIESMQARNLPIHILLTKADKLSKNEQLKIETIVKRELQVYGERVSYQLFSALKGLGVSKFQSVLNHWFGF